MIREKIKALLLSKGIISPNDEVIDFLEKYWIHIESNCTTPVRVISGMDIDTITRFIIPGMNIIAAHLYWRDKKEEVDTIPQHHTPEGMYDKIANKIAKDLDSKSQFKGWHHYFGESFSDTTRSMYGEEEIDEIEELGNIKDYLRNPLIEKEDMSRVISIDSLSEMVKDEAFRKMEKYLSKLEENANAINDECSLPDTEYNEEVDVLKSNYKDSKSYFLDEMKKALESDGCVSLTMVRAKLDHMKNVFVRTNIYMRDRISEGLVKGNLFNPSYEEAKNGMSCVLYWHLKCEKGNAFVILNNSIDVFKMININEVFYTVYANDIPKELYSLDSIPKSVINAFE